MQHEICPQWTNCTYSQYRYYMHFVVSNILRRYTELYYSKASDQTEHTKRDSDIEKAGSRDQTEHTFEAN